MRRDQLEHAIRTACQIIGHPDIIVGSQAILGSIVEEELPAAATMSMEVDILPIATDRQRRDRAPGRPHRGRSRRVLPLRGSARIQHRRGRPADIGSPARLAGPLGAGQ